MEKRGTDKYAWLRLTNLGYEKGKTPASKSTVEHSFKEALKCFYNV